jgi:hypothetical protein
MHVDDLFLSYSSPKKIIIEIAISIIRNKKRSIKHDSLRAISGIFSPVQFIGKENIPVKGPGMVTLNHYSRPGFFILWAAMVISACLPEKHFWLMTSAWTNRTKGVDQLRAVITRELFKRLARMYGFITTPPMPPIPGEIAERALSIKKIIGAINEDPKTILCFAPEGQDFGNGVLGEPPAGIGKFFFNIHRQLKKIYSVGVWEENESLILNFGESYIIGNSHTYRDPDTEISNLVMSRIAELLPTSF